MPIERIIRPGNHASLAGKYSPAPVVDGQVPAHVGRSRARFTFPSGAAPVAVWLIGFLGIVGATTGVWWAFHAPETTRADSSAGLTSLLEKGVSLESEIARSVRPAMQRTEILSRDAQLCQLLSDDNRAGQTAWINRAVTTGTELDALALFDSSGGITAINTRYSDGQQIPKARTQRILDANFAKREIVQKCLRNGVTSSVLEFQTHCDITPALFDSTGLSVAYSVPVLDPKTGRKLGVISARLRFERLSSLIQERAAASSAAKIYFVSDVGTYFSETINSGKETPPIPVNELAEIVRPLIGGRASQAITRRGDGYVLILPLSGFQTLDRGGINVLVLADEHWLVQGARRDRLLQAAGIALASALLLIVAGLIHAGITSRRIRRTNESANAANAWLAGIVECSTDAVVGVALDGIIVSWNSAAERVFGYTAAEAKGRSIDLIEPPGRKLEIAGLRELALADKRLDNIETQRLRKDGQLIEVSTSVAVIKDKTGTPIGFTGTTRDVTLQKLALDRVRKSEATLAEAQSIAHLGSWIWDLQANTLEWSDEHYRIWGLRPQQCSMTIEIAMSSVHPQDRRFVQILIDQAIAAREPYQCCMRVTRPDGTVRTVQSSGHAVYDVHGKALQLVGTSQDVTDRQLVEDKIHLLNSELEQRVQTRTAALQDSEQRFRQLAENTNDVFWMTSAAGDRFLYVSPRFQDIWDRTCQELYGNPRTWLDSIEPDDLPVVLNAWKDVCVTGKYEVEYRIHRPDNTVRWIRDRALPVRNDEGEIYRIAGIAEDITDRRRAEQELIEATEIAEAANHAKSEFLAKMSHEIRTPLNGVIGMTDLLLNSSLDAQQQRFARLIKTSGQALAELINDILDFSKIEAGKLELESIDFDLRALLEDVNEVMAYRAAEKHVELASCAGPDVPRFARGDPARVKQILVNLVSNGIKFTDAGSVTTTLTVESRSSEHVTVRFAITDTGIGIAPEGLRRLFKSFSQVDASTTRTHGGSGLGLVIAKQLAQLMGGVIGVESVAKQGSTFWFTVKLAPASAPSPDVIEDADLGHARVLVVQNNPVLLEVISNQLQRWGMDNAAAPNGLVALQMLTAAATESRPYRVAILDSDIDDNDALDLGRTIKSRPEISDTSLLMLLPMASKVELIKLSGAGFSGHLFKPIRQSQLHDAIISAIAAVHVSSIPKPMMAEPSTSERALNEVTPRDERILIAEDNRINQIVASEILARHGYTFDIVDNGRKTADAETQNYDLILMDCSMPEMDGFAATEEIRRKENGGAARNGRRIPIIALTANAIQGDRERCIAAGMDAYVAKPVDAVKLIQAIQSLLASRERREDPEENSDPVAQGVSAADSSPPFAVDQLLDRCMGNVETALMIMDEFEKQAMSNVRELELTVARGDGLQAASIAHALKGASGVLAAEHVRFIASELEGLGRAAGLGNAEPLLAQLRAEVCRCIEFLTIARQTVSVGIQVIKPQGA